MNSATHQSMARVREEEDRLVAMRLQAKLKRMLPEKYFPVNSERNNQIDMRGRATPNQIERIKKVVLFPKFV